MLNPLPSWVKGAEQLVNRHPAPVINQLILDRTKNFPLLSQFGKSANCLLRFPIKDVHVVHVDHNLHGLSDPGSCPGIDPGNKIMFP